MIILSFPYTLFRTDTRSFSLSHTHKYTHTHTHTHTHIDAFFKTHSTHSHTLTHTHIHTHTLFVTHTHTLYLVQSHTHTHTYPLKHKHTLYLVQSHTLLSLLSCRIFVMMATDAHYELYHQSRIPASSSSQYSVYQRFGQAWL